MTVEPSYKNVRLGFTAPADADYSGTFYATAPAGQVPSRTSWKWAGTSPMTTAPDLVMDSDYTLALWTMDTLGNVSDPVLVPFRTLLDSTPPGPLADLQATGGAYAVSVSWVPPSDGDLTSQTLVLTDLETDAKTTSPTLLANASSYTFARLPGGRSYRVEAFATDQNGLTSPVVTGEATTAPDENGPPPAIPLSAITVTPVSTRGVIVSFPRPDIPDFKGAAYEVRAIGADLDPIGPLWAMRVNSTTVSTTVTLPQAGTAYQVVIHVWDHNNNRARTVIPSVQGAPSVFELPLAPASYGVASVLRQHGRRDVAQEPGQCAGDLVDGDSHLGHAHPDRGRPGRSDHGTAD